MTTNDEATSGLWPGILPIPQSVLDQGADAEDQREAPTRQNLYADAVNLAAQRSPFGHPLPQSEIRAAWAGVDAALAARPSAPTVTTEQVGAAVIASGLDHHIGASDTIAFLAALGIEVTP
jgi:hypothetical protein